MKVVTLVGADASGKDTQLAKLKAHFESLGKKVQIITIWDSLGEFAAIPDKKILRQTIETFLLNYEPEARSFFLLSCLKNSESKMRSDVDYVFLNGFFHKYWASEAAYGVSHDFWNKNCSHFHRSDVMIYLNTSLEQCLQRKEEWSNYEQGKGRFYGEAIVSRELFQKKLHAELDKIMDGQSDVSVIKGDHSAEQVFEELLKLL